MNLVSLIGVSLAATLLLAWSAYAQQGVGGKPAREKPLFRDFMGINGHTFQFDPKLYAPVCRLVRDYHNFDWDIGDSTANETTFPLSRLEITWKAPPGKWRDHNGRVNWDELYGSWIAEGLEVDACIQFGKVTIDKWVNVEADAYRYGKAFAEAFGPSGKTPRVTSIEIGNEPAGDKRYSPEDFKKVHVSMARAIREADPKLKIVTCTVEAVEPDAWSMPLEMFRDIPDLYDVINLHKYAHPPGGASNRRSYPEDPALPFLQTLQHSIDWRNQHAPDKEVWITEFGYDASTQPPRTEGPGANYRGVTDLQQAQWIVRSFLVFSEMEFDRAYLYFFNDNDTPTPHAAAGVTRRYEPKMSYHAMAHLYKTLGDYRFARVVEKNVNGAWVYEFTHERDADNVVWVAWLATGEDRDARVTLNLPGRLQKAERMPTSADDNTTADLKQSDDGSAEVPLTESPLYLHIRR